MFVGDYKCIFIWVNGLVLVNGSNNLYPIDVEVYWLIFACNSVLVLSNLPNIVVFKCRLF